MGHRLARSFAIIDSDIETLDLVVLPLDFRFQLVQQDKEGVSLPTAQIEQIFHVPPRDDERMEWGDGVAVADRIRKTIGMERPLHVVLGWAAMKGETQNMLRLITLYTPTVPKWTDPRTRGGRS